MHLLRLNRPLCLTLATLVASAFLLGACDSTGPSNEGSNVSVGFSSSTSTTKTATTGADVKSSHDALEIAGPNDTLSITDIRLVVSEIEIEGDADSADFEAGPSFLDLPLNATDVAPVASNQIPPGTYNEFEFEVEDVEVDDEDDDEEKLQDLRDAIRDEFPEWPAGASMVVVGTFRQDDGTTSNFTTFFAAEIEAEQELSTPLEVTGDGASRELTVRLGPAQWFRNADGTVRNLAELASTEELPEFEAEFEFKDGVTEIEVDGPEDED